MIVRSVLFLCVFLLPATVFAQGRPLDLASVGEPRALPERLLGASAEAFWTDCLRDPAKAAAIKSLHLAFTRFPGGSQSNYYDWKRGQFSLPAGPHHSPYYEKIVELSHTATHSMPGGSFLEPYKTFCESMGAEIVMVPNLETASVADQVAWFKHLSSKGAVPSHIELGNEFWIAMGDDPVVLRRWPDEPTSMRAARRYLDAIRVYLPKGAKVAVQAAAPLFHGGPSSHGKMMERLRRWNEDLHPEPWFDAVTIHLYPRLNEVIGHGAAEDEITPQIARRNLRALMARVDEGTGNQLDDIVRRVPGKEIWVTEWNPGGAEGEGKKHRAETTTPAMMLQLVTRMTLAFLRHPQVTVSQFFAVRFKPDSPKCMFLAAKGATGRCLWRWPCAAERRGQRRGNLPTLCRSRKPASPAEACDRKPTVLWKPATAKQGAGYPDPPERLGRTVRLEGQPGTEARQRHPMWSRWWLRILRTPRFASPRWNPSLPRRTFPSRRIP